jgi:hypothetical protein
MIEFPEGIDQSVYEQVNARVNPPGSPPDGLIFHSAGPGPDGRWRIVDVWNERATFDRFFEGTVGPVLGEILGGDPSDGPQPTVTSWPVVSYNAGPEL